MSQQGNANNLITRLSRMMALISHTANCQKDYDKRFELSTNQISPNSVNLPPILSFNNINFGPVQNINGYLIYPLSLADRSIYTVKLCITDIDILSLILCGVQNDSTDPTSYNNPIPFYSVINIESESTENQSEDDNLEFQMTLYKYYAKNTYALWTANLSQHPNSIIMIKIEGYNYYIIITPK